MGRRAVVVSAATMLSRLLGLVRETIFAALLGSTAYAEAFFVAFRIPNLARDLFAEGALSAAFVPTFADTLQREGRAAAVRLANLVVGLVLLVVGGIAAIGIVIAPWLVDAMTGFSDPHTTELTVRATRLLFPFLPVISLAAVAMGQLNAQERFTAPALAPATFNVVAISTGVWLLVTDPAGESVYMILAGAMLAGGVAQLLVQWPALRGTGYRVRPRISLRHPGVRRILALMLPAVIGLAATNVNMMVNTLFATLQTGSVAWLQYAFRLIYLPIGVFAVAIATISTTRLAQRAAERDMEGVTETLSEGLRLVAFLAIPSTVGLIVLGEPIVRLIYERGDFLATDTPATAAALVMYALGLYAYSAVKVTAPAFYALDKPRAALVASLCAVAVNLLLNLLLFESLGFRGLALGTAAGATVNVLVLTLSYRSLTGAFPFGDLARHAGRVLVATTPCGVAAWLTLRGVETSVGTATLGARLLAVLPAVAVGAFYFAATAWALRLAELDEVVSFVRRRRGR